MATILVVGGTGLIGAPVARQLQAAGHAVRVLTRNPEPAQARFGPGFDVRGGDVEDPRALAAALFGCEGVHLSLDGGRDPDLERRGMTAIARAARDLGVSQITYLSGATVDPRHAWYAGTQAKLAAEEALRASGVPFTIFRATFFMESLARYVRDGRASVVGAQPHRWHWVAASDFGRMVARAFETPAAAGQTLTVAGPEALTLREALTRYVALAHPGLAVNTLPLWLAGLFAALSPKGELAARLPFFRYTEQVGESGDPAPANALLGAPRLTLEAWTRQRLAEADA